MNKHEITDLYDSVRAYFSTYYLFRSQSHLDFVTAYSMHTYIYDWFTATPYGALAGPPRSGKSMLLKLIQAISCNARMTVAPSAAAIYRTIPETGRITFLIDQAETFAGKSAERDPDKMAVVNQGNEAGIGSVLRQGVDGGSFNLYCPKIFAGTLELEKALSTRSTVLRLTGATIREQKTNGIRRGYRTEQDTKDIRQLASRLQEWANNSDTREFVETALQDANKLIPEHLNDSRTANGWMALFVIGEQAGRLKDIHAALEELHCDYFEDVDEDTVMMTIGEAFDIAFKTAADLGYLKIGSYIPSEYPPMRAAKCLPNLNGMSDIALGHAKNYDFKIQRDKRVILDIDSEYKRAYLLIPGSTDEHRNQVADSVLESVRKASPNALGNMTMKELSTHLRTEGRLVHDRDRLKIKTALRKGTDQVWLYKIVVSHWFWPVVPKGK